jgi:hypothetical protein
MDPRVRELVMLSALAALGKTNIGSAVSLYRSKFSDYSAGAVLHSYPNVDLL